MISRLIWLGIFVVLVPAIFYIVSHSPNAQTFTPGENLLGTVIGAAIFAYVLQKLILLSIRRPFLGIPIMAIMVAVPLALWFMFGYPIYKQTKVLSAIQTNLTNVASAKLLGNSVISKGKLTSTSLSDVQSSVTAASAELAELSVPDLLKNYRQVALIWADKIVAAAQNTKAWKNLNNQPGDFPLELSDSQVQTFFQSSIKTIAGLKQAGADAIKNKDKQAMRLVAAKLLIQKHWLNGILYSKSSDTAAFNLITPVFAQGVPDIQGVDVTCQVCSDPKIKWTDLLRQQYGCDTRCRPQQTQTQNTKTEQQTQDEQNDTNNFSAEDIKELESFTYKGKPKRAICIGTGGLSVGGSMTNVFCVEDAVTTITEIAFSAIGFTDGTKVLSETQWEEEYKEIDDMLASKPSVEGGHLLEGMGTIGNSEPDLPPQPTKATSKPITQPKPVQTDTSAQDYSVPELPDLSMPIQTGDPTRGSGPVPVFDLERDYSAEQTGGSDRW